MDQAAYGAIDEVCEEFVSKSNATCALLVGQDGMLLHRSGAVADLDVDSLSALAAGSFASASEMAGLIGESTFDVAIQQGQQNHLQMIRVGDEAILVVVFDDQTTAAMVRLHGQRAAQRLAGVLAGGAEGAAAPEEGEGGPDGFIQQTQQRTEQLRSSFRLRTVSMVLALLAAIVAVLGALLRQ
jgi:predicted regulator of Ras-like GTPase activity (Roadblock/LC7/MglB family)